MVGPRVYHLKHARSYPAFNAQDPAKVMDLAVRWLNNHDFRTKRKSKQYCRGSKRGIHVNFVPKFKLYIEQGTNGQYIVRFDYYAKIKLGTAVVVGVLTSGISTVIGVGTLAVTLSDADHFVDKFWQHIDSLARGAPVILTVERWASDGKGNFVKQPAPPVSTIPAGIVPVGSAPPPLPPKAAHTGPPPSQHYYPPPNPTAPPPNYNAPPPNYNAPPPNYNAPPPNYNAPPPNYNAPPPNYNAPPPNYTPPPNQNNPNTTHIQPGQVYGHNPIQIPQAVQNSPPPPPLYYPQLDNSFNYPPPTNAGGYPQPLQASSYSSSHYPPPTHSYNQSSTNSYPPPPSPSHQAYSPPHSYSNYPPPPPSRAGDRTSDYPTHSYSQQAGYTPTYPQPNHDHSSLKDTHSSYAEKNNTAAQRQSYFADNQSHNVDGSYTGDTASYKDFNPWESQSIHGARQQTLQGSGGTSYSSVSVSMSERKSEYGSRECLSNKAKPGTPTV